MRRSSIVFSTLIHIAFLVLAYLGLPDWWQSVELETSIPVQMVENISDITTPPKSEPETTQPKPVEPEEQVAAEPPPPAPPVPPAPPEPVEEIKAPDPEPLPEPIPDETVADGPEPDPEPEPEPEQVQLAEVPPAKPEPPQDLPKPEEPKPEADAFESLLKDLENVTETQTAEVTPTETPTPPQPTQSLSNADISISAKDALRQYINSCWNFDPGSRDASELMVVMSLWLNPDGSVINLEIEDNGRMRSDPFYRSAAESAQRAVLRCQPYGRFLASEPYDVWKFMTLRFNPADIAR